ncbi:hypothetical protein V8B55DRAFT_1550528 [Mucor lusitanicus]|nr:hypothetical protein FB192DRAFT_1397131 [Mucor lusitanicus]
MVSARFLAWSLHGLTHGVNMVQSHMVQSKVSELLCHCLYMVSSVIALWKPVVFFMAYGLLLVVFTASGWYLKALLCLAIAFYPRCLGNQWSSL